MKPIEPHRIISKMNLLLVMTLTPITLADKLDPATDQIVYFKNRTMGPVGVITTSAGAPVSYIDATNTLNTKLINNEFFMDSVSHVVRERIPERVVHAKGAGAYGYFEVTHDISNICKANFLSKIGKKTRVVMRISVTTSERGSSDLALSPRGFSIKFYSKEGNWDVVGFNTPMYFYKDPINFPAVVHSRRRNPATHLMDPKTFWDFATLRPEALHSFILLFAGRGIPASLGNTPGFSIQTYQVENKKGDKRFVRFHFLPDGGIKNFTSQEARNISAADPDYLTRDLYRRIENCDYPIWSVFIQIATLNDVKKNGSRIFDVTRVLPIKEFPLFPIGKLVLNENVKNVHAEIEQLAFNPSNLVPGISGGPDKIFESRRLVYREAQNHRLGLNFNKITVNCPFQQNTYNRDGVPPVRDNEKDVPNYYPNTFNGPVPYIDNNESKLIKIIENSAVDNFDQAAYLYANELSNNDRNELLENLVSSLQQVTKNLQIRATKILTTIHPDLGYRVSLALNRKIVNQIEYPGIFCLRSMNLK